MDIRKKIVLSSLGISIFVFLVTALVVVYSLSSRGENVPDFLQPFLQYHIEFMVIMGFSGIALGLVAYSIMRSTIEKQKKTAQVNLNIIMKFLGQDDKNVITLLISKGGTTTQSQISTLPGMSRLKAHRTVKKLEDRGIVHVEKEGKINMVRLVDELKEATNRNL